MKLSRILFSAIVGLMAVSCGSSGSTPQDEGSDGMPDVVLDTPVVDTGSETRDEGGETDIQIRDEGPDDSTIPDSGKDIPDTTDVRTETADGCECGSPEDCKDAFADLGLCEKTVCQDCTCVRLFKEIDEECDDGNSCTEGDKCSADHVCVPGANNCPCTGDQDCDRYNNDNKCDGSYKCNLQLATPACEIDPLSIVQCEDTVGSPCRTVGCDPATGDCVDVNINEAGPCSDNVDCTIDDKCVEGECLGTPKQNLCFDNDPCTDDSCDPLSGCTFVNNTASCTDNNACTDGDHCVDGDCVPGPELMCGDDNSCTSEYCDALLGCVITNLTDPCDDDNACTATDVCSNGACVGSVEACCKDGIDNDNNQTSDCADPACIMTTDCPVTITSCMLMAPSAFTGYEGTSFESRVKITAAGITDRTVGTDVHPLLTVEWAIGPAGTTADGFDALTWNTAAGDQTASDPASDTYLAGMTIPGITDTSLNRDYIFRVSGDGGTTWTYCDSDGSENGYATELAGKITIRPPYNLYFSEYMEGLSNNKAAEIFNAGPFPAWLGDCSILVYSNGATTTSNVTALSSVDLPSGGTFVACHDQIAADKDDSCAVKSSKVNFNGDDATVLVCDGTVQDIIGVIGQRPASGGWGVDDIFTKDRTLRRHCSVTHGTGDGIAEFNQPEWMAFPTDTWQGLGSRQCNGPCTGDETETCCSDGLDSDVDGRTDCDDPDCKGNQDCLVPVDWCRLIAPWAVRSSPGMIVLAQGWVAVAGMTDTTTGNDNPANLKGQFGYGPDGSSPDDTWTWLDAAPATTNNADRTDADSYDHVFEIPVAPLGSYDLAFRFSADAGYSWTYCDKDGTDNGYSTAESGSMEIVTIPNVYISEYVDGSGDDKAIEIFNNSGRTLDLDNCSITIYADGAMGFTSSMRLGNGVLADQDVFVICKTGASTELSPFCDAFKSVLDFNGNDALVLVCEDKPMDSFGQRGFNPGDAGWGSGNVTTAAHTLRRMCTVSSGDPVATDAFSPAAEWWSFAKDTFEGLGNHVCDNPCYQDGGEVCCHDVLDDDFDGLTDCLDPDCDDFPECAPPEIAFAAIEPPLSISFTFGESSPILRGRVGVPGVTDKVGAGAGITGQAGWGPDGSIPDDTWNWFDAAYVADADLVDDRFESVFYDVPVGTWDYAFRFSVDGTTWTYADAIIAGSTDGYSPANAGSMIVTAGMETACTDDVDNDGDLLADCLDSDCGSDPACIIPSEELSCTGGVDEDQDGNTDCDDQDCWDESICLTPVDWCQLVAQSPIISVAGPQIEIRAWVAEAGMTDLSAANDSPAGLTAEFGYGIAGSAPATSWNWQDAAPAFSNTSPRQDADTYRYNLTIPAEVPGNYDFAMRFSADGGRSWLYCDLDGSDNGFDQANQAGKLTIPTTEPNVMFTEYVEGTGNNKALELKNVSGRRVMMYMCDLSMYVDGSTSPAFAIGLNSQGYLEDGATFTICSDLAPEPLRSKCDALTPFFTFDGNDSLSLTCENQLMDFFGQHAVDPGSAGWGSGNAVTTDRTLRRQCSVTQGDRNRTDAFDPAAEWWAFPADSVGDVGSTLCGTACFADGKETCCEDTLDNDLDGLSDCSDPDCATATPCLPPPKLIFSEYLEGSSNNKFVEILNYDTVTVSMTGCKIEVYANGSATANTSVVTLTADIAAGDVWVVCNSGMGTPQIGNCDQTSAALAYNGDDALVLRCNGKVVDSFGKVGEDPGAGWIASPSTWDTVDDCLCRTERTADTTINDTFNPGTQWANYGNDYYAGMGTAACSPL